MMLSVFSRAYWPFVYILWRNVCSDLLPPLFLKINLFIYLALLGLRCCARAFSSCGERGLLFVAVHGLLLAVASLVAEHGLQARRLSSCGARA